VTTSTGRLLVVFLLIVVAFPAAAAGQATTPGAPPDAELFSIEGSLMGVLQGIANGDAKRGSVFGFGSLDLNVTLRPARWIELFLNAEALGGPGPDQGLGSLSRLNDASDRLDGRDKRVIIRELVLRLSWLDERVLLHVGKLDVDEYFDRNRFAQDETTQFLSSALVENPMLGGPPNGAGAILVLRAGPWHYSFGVLTPDGVDRDLSGLPFIIGEVNRRDIFALEGNYGVWARASAVFDDRDRTTWGTGVTADQLVTPQIGVFLRAGISRSQGEDLTSWAWSVGVQLTPTWLGRRADALGVAYSDQRVSEGRERLAEAYYRFTVADWLYVIPNVQWILSGPNQVTGGVNRHVVVPGVRALLQF
jgi:hypothetical protein